MQRMVHPYPWQVLPQLGILVTGSKGRLYLLQARRTIVFMAVASQACLFESAN